MKLVRQNMKLVNKTWNWLQNMKLVNKKYEIGYKIWNWLDKIWNWLDKIWNWLTKHEIGYKIWNWLTKNMKLVNKMWNWLQNMKLEWECEMFQTKVVQKIKVHILCSVKFFFFSKFVPFFKDNLEKQCRAGQPTNDDMAHSHCMLDT